MTMVEPRSQLISDYQAIRDFLADIRAIAAAERERVAELAAELKRYREVGTAIGLIMGTCALSDAQAQAALSSSAARLGIAEPDMAGHVLSAHAAGRLEEAMVGMLPAGGCEDLAADDPLQR